MMIDRIKLIMQHFGLSSTQFADTIGAQRSAMSHILSERNKPSLDFILKVKAAFSNLKLDWLLLGEGEMIESDKKGSTLRGGKVLQAELPFERKDNVEREQVITETVKNSHRKEEKIVSKTENVPLPIVKTANNMPEFVMVFYLDGSFKTYKPKN